VSRITRRLEKLTRDLVGGRSKEIGALAREIAAMTDGHLLDETARVTDDIRWRGQGPERYAELMALNEHGKRAPSRGVGFIGEMSDDELRAQVADVKHQMAEARAAGKTGTLSVIYDEHDVAHVIDEDEARRRIAARKR